MTDANTPRTAAALGTPLRRWLRSARTRRQTAKALGGGDNPNDTYLRMATAVLNFLWTDAINQPHTDPTWKEAVAAAPTPAPAHVHGQGEICDADCPHWQWAEAAAPTPTAPRFDNPRRCAYCGSKGEHLFHCDNPRLAAARPEAER